MKKILFILVFACGTFAYAQQFSYKPLNPAFGGESFNYNWLLSSANAQNGYEEPSNTRTPQSALDRFGASLNQQVLSQISRSLLSQQLGGFNFNEEGTFTFGTLNVEIFDSQEGLVINILDTSNGEETQVIVPNP